jgi:hypothetical protein
LFPEFHPFVIKLISDYKELSLLKFGSGDFTFFSLLESNTIFVKTSRFHVTFFC